MKFLVDESADARLAAHLNSLGHDAKTVAGDYAQAPQDEQVLSIALREQRILIARKSSRNFPANRASITVPLGQIVSSPQEMGTIVDR